MLLICLVHNLAQIRCFMLYSLGRKLMETQLSRTKQNEWLGKHCSDFTDKDSWLPNSPDLNPHDYHVWEAILEQVALLSQRGRMMLRVIE